MKRTLTIIVGAVAVLISGLPVQAQSKWQIQENPGGRQFFSVKKTVSRPAPSKSSRSTYSMSKGGEIVAQPSLYPVSARSQRNGDITTTYYSNGMRSTTHHNRDTSTTRFSNGAIIKTRHDGDITTSTYTPPISIDYQFKIDMDAIKPAFDY